MQFKHRAILMACFLLAASAVRAETTQCVAVEPPARITEPGLYCLFRDYTLDVARDDFRAIEVAAHNVTIDFNGHVMQYNKPQFKNSVGVNADGKNNVTVRNGVIRGFEIGIALKDFDHHDETGGSAVTGMTIDDCYIWGIYVDGKSFLISNNRVTNLGASADDAVRGGPIKIGIFAYGSGLTINNEILNMYTTRSVIGISAGGAAGMGGYVVSGNRLSGFNHRKTDSKTTAISAKNAGGIIRDNWIDEAASQGAATRDVTGIVYLDSFQSMAGSIPPFVVRNDVQVTGTAYNGPMVLGPTR